VAFNVRESVIIFRIGKAIQHQMYRIEIKL